MLRNVKNQARSFCNVKKLKIAGRLIISFLKFSASRFFSWITGKLMQGGTEWQKRYKQDSWTTVKRIQELDRVMLISIKHLKI
jgi:hypothetical protein